MYVCTCVSVCPSVCRREASTSSDTAAAARTAADRLQIEKVQTYIQHAYTHISIVAFSVCLFLFCRGSFCISNPNSCFLRSHEQNQLESRLQTEEVRLTAALKRAEDLSDELGNLRAAHELKLKLDRAQRAPAAGSDAQATRIRALESSLAEAEAGRRYAEDELRKEKDLSVRATQDALRETQKAKTLSKKLEQQEARLADVESQLRDVMQSQAGQRLEVEIALAKARAAENAKADLQRQVDELQTENKSLAARVTRASRFVKPMRTQTSSVPEAFAEKIDFGVHMLKKTGSKWLEGMFAVVLFFVCLFVCLFVRCDYVLFHLCFHRRLLVVLTQTTESRAQAEAASRPSTGLSPLAAPQTPPMSPPQPQPR